jgi:hypothetical protein
MLNEENCLVYPILQKFYSSLTCLVGLDPERYIFENVPKVDIFLQEFRNITWITRKHFNTPELKQIYEDKKNEHLSNKEMRLKLYKGQNPCVGVIRQRENPPREKYFTIEDIKNLLLNAEGIIKPLLAFALLT